VPATIIVGTQWGDEGKGRFTDLFAKEMHPGRFRTAVGVMTKFRCDREKKQICGTNAINGGHEGNCNPMPDLFDVG
jgi:hypothetical protein